MPLRRLVLLFTAACVPAPDPAPAAGAPVDVKKSAERADPPGPPSATTGSPAATGSSATPVPKDSPTTSAPTAATTPSDTSARLLHDHLQSFAALADGALLVAPRSVWVDAAGTRQTGPDGLHLLAPDGSLTPWSQGWRPTTAGWKLEDPDADHGGSPLVSPDGRWVALQHVFTPTSAPRRGEQDVIAIVVSRADGSEPRCVGVAILEDEGVAPPLAWTADSTRLIGGWSGQCEPDPRGRVRDFADGKKFGAWPRPMRWFAPRDGSAGETPGVWHHEIRDPLGDAVAVGWSDGAASGTEFLDIATGARLGAVAEAAGTIDDPSGWLTADAVLADVYSEPGRELLGHRILRTDGRAVAAPGPGWRIYTRLADGSSLFTRDAGASVEQGRIDPADFTVTASRPRPDLARFAGPFKRSGGLFGKVTRPPTWTPALGGVLLHEPDSGALWLAAI